MRISICVCGIVIAALGASASAGAQGAAVPFDAASAPSEQLSYSGSSPRVVGVAAGDSVTVAWQSYAAGQPTAALLTHYTRSAGAYARAWEKPVPLPRLAGMTSDGTNFYVLSAAAEDLSSDSTALSYRPNILILTKFDGQGNQLWQRDLNSAEFLGDPNAEGVASTAIFSPLTAGTGALAYGNGKIAVAIASNTLPDANISQRHQRAQYFLVGEDGSGYKSAEETSWRHSFDQRLLFDGRDFVFTDVGDASWYMPGAGIALRKIQPTPNGADFVGPRQGVYVYVRQGDTAGSQNFSFTSLGDLERGTRGYVALFSSEKGNPGATRDGWQEPVNEPRNLGLVHVTEGFASVTEGRWDGDETLGNTIIEGGSPTAINVTSNVVDSDGPSNRFTRADKPEKSFTQTGIVWLTDLASGVSAERPKFVRIADDRYIAAWEEWSYSAKQLTYVASKAMLLNERGEVLRPATTLDARLNPSGADRFFVLDGRAAWIAASGGKLNLYSLDADLALTAAPLGSTDAPREPPPATPPTVRQTDRLTAGDTLTSDQRIQSPNGQYTLVYQTDGNLVLYDASSLPLWASNTSGRPVGRTIMQDDGNLVIYGPTDEFIWNTGTVSFGSSVVLQDDGNLVIYDATGAAIWASNTAR